MDKQNPPPHRRIEAEIHIGADSWKDLQEMVGDIGKAIEEVSQADENLYWVSPGKHASADVCLKVDHDMTHSQYARDMDQWHLSTRKDLHHAEKS